MLQYSLLEKHNNSTQYKKTVNYITYNMIIEDSGDEEYEYEYEVENILSKKIKNGKTYYKVKWKNYSKEEASWEPEENLKNAPAIVSEFEEKLLERKRKRKRKEHSSSNDSVSDDKSTELSHDTKPIKEKLIRIKEMFKLDGEVYAKAQFEMFNEGESGVCTKEKFISMKELYESYPHKAREIYEEVIKGITIERQGKVLEKYN